MNSQKEFNRLCSLNNMRKIINVVNAMGKIIFFINYLEQMQLLILLKDIVLKKKKYPPD